MFPNRVIVDDGGLGTTPERAEREYGIVPEVIFVRGDKWSLGAPLQFEEVAYQLWKNEWTHYAYRKDGYWRSIGSYKQGV